MIISPVGGNSSVSFPYRIIHTTLSGKGKMLCPSLLRANKKSILLKPSLKAEAKEDKDFQNYWCDNEFNAIIQD
jgi:hypothetical protein